MGSKIYVNEEGKSVYRVSDIIKILSKEGIARWANILGFKHIKYDDELANAAIIGTIVHHIIEVFNNTGEMIINNQIFQEYGLNPVLNGKNVNAIYNAISSFRKWYEKYSEWYIPIETEKQLVGKLYGGTIDVLLRGVKSKNKVIIGDYKTSSKPYFTMFLQLAAYTKLYEEIYGKDTVEGVMIILLDKKKGCRACAYYIKRRKLIKFMEAFDSLLNTAISIEEISEHFLNYTDDIFENS